MSTIQAPANAEEALAMLDASLGYFTGTDMTGLPAETQGRCLRKFEQAEAMLTVARSAALSAFTAAQGYLADGAYGAKSWLMHMTLITRGEATGHMAWARRLAAHPRIAVAMAEKDLTASYAKSICEQTSKLPEAYRDAADAILVSAAQAGADLQGLFELIAEMQARAAQDNPDDDSDGPDGPEDGFGDRELHLDATFGGAGVIGGDLTPECTALVQSVLDALSAPQGPEDTRSLPQRYHDALHEAMRRLLAGDLLPDRAGSPVKAWVHIALAELMLLDGDSTLQDEWKASAQAQWAAHRASGSVTGPDGSAWLAGDAADGIACDATLSPVVTGDINLDALQDLVWLSTELGRILHHDHPGHPGTAADANPETGTEPDVSPDPAADGPEPCPDAPPAGAPAGPAGPRPGAGLSREALELAIIGKAVDLVSGPGGLASFLRRRELGARLGGPSLPLDIGYSDTIPAGIRNAVKLRDRHCQWAGRCHQPAAACEVHHLKHKSRGGKTSVKDCVLLCHFHHQVMIHRLGWTLVLNPDGTTTAFNKDKTKILHSHSPPARPG